MDSEQLNLQSDDINQLSKIFETGTPRNITFRSSEVNYQENEKKTVNITVHIENGDVGGILKVVMDQGGIGAFNGNDVYDFIPWPCALVEVEDVD